MTHRWSWGVLTAALVLSGCDVVENHRVRSLVQEELGLPSIDGLSVVERDNWGFASRGGDVALIQLDRGTCRRVAASLGPKTLINQKSHYYRLHKAQGLTAQFVRTKRLRNKAGLLVNYALEESSCILARENWYD